jgi:hypothetical protein
MRNSSDCIRGARRASAPASRPGDDYRPGDDPDLQRDLRRAVAAVAAGKRLDLAPPAPWYPLPEALICCDPGGWEKWSKLAKAVAPDAARRRRDDVGRRGGAAPAR